MSTVIVRAVFEEAGKCYLVKVFYMNVWIKNKC